MNENREIIPNKKRFITRLYDIFELIKSKIDKNYTLNNKSPKELQENTDLIINTLHVYPEYLKEIIPSVVNDYNKINVIIKYCFQNNFTLEQIPKQYFKKSYVLSSIIENYLVTGQNISDLLNYIETNGGKIGDFLQYFNSNSKKLIIANPLILQEIFEHAGIAKVSSILDVLFSNEEIEELFNVTELPHDIKRLQDLYNIDHKILKDIDIRLLLSKYDNIPLNKLHIFARIPEIQQNILNLNEFELALYYKMSSNMANKTDNWFEYENNILHNFSNGKFNAVLKDLYQNAINGNKINAIDVDSLTNIFSSRSAENLFNITTKNELEQYDEIKQHVCDIVLQNPNLDNLDLTSDEEKYMNGFRQLNVLDRCKIAILQKYYNLSLMEATEIIDVFGKNVSELPCNLEKDAQIVEIITALRNICECNSLELLMNVENLNLDINADLSNCVMLEQQCKELYGKMYQEKLYHPNESDYVSSTTYNEEKINIYKPSNFEGMIVKRIGTLNSFGINIFALNNGINFNTYKEAWKDFGDKIRFRTSTSYMTPETLLTSPHGKFGDHRFIYYVGF